MILNDLCSKILAQHKEDIINQYGIILTNKQCSINLIGEGWVEVNKLDEGYDVQITSMNKNEIRLIVSNENVTVWNQKGMFPKKLVYLYLEEALQEIMRFNELCEYENTFLDEYRKNLSREFISNQEDVCKH